MVRNPKQQQLNLIWTSKLLEISVFLMLCLMTDRLQHWHPITGLPEAWQIFLGRPPQAMHIAVICGLYVVSVVIMAGAAFSVGKRPQLSWKHLGYRAGFIMFDASRGEASDLFSLLIGICLGLYFLELIYIAIHLYQDNHRRVGKPSQSSWHKH